MWAPPTAVVGMDQNGRAPHHIFTTEGLTGELRQGEIISGLVQHVYDEESRGVDAIQHEYVVVLSQDCDLLWDYQRRQDNVAEVLYGVIFCQAKTADRIRQEQGINSRTWRILIQNREERFHALERVPPENDLLGNGLGPLVVDLKMIFAVNPSVVYKQLRLGSGAVRRCRIDVPYREHLQTRAAFYFQRVALPQPHRIADEIV